MTRYAKTMSQALAEVRQVNEGILSQLVRITRGLGSGDKDKKDMKTDGKGGFGIKDTKGKVIDFVDKERAKEILDFAAKKGYKISSPDKEPKTGRFEKELEKMVKAPMQRSLQMSQEEVELDEKYDLYHKSFSDAMQHAYDYAQKKMGITVDKSEIDRKVATGPKKPTEGKTNKYRLKGKGGNLQIQVYNKGGSKPFELNMYKEEVELDEAKFQVNYSKGGKLFSKTVNAKNEDDAEDKAIKQFKIEDDDIRSVVKEGTELDEMDMKYVLINMQGKVQGYASDKKDALDIAKRTKSTMHPIKKKISDKTLEKMNALQKTPKELKDLGIIEEVEMNELKMNDPKLLKIFDKLKPKDTIKLKVSSGISKGKDLQPYTVRSKNTLRNGVEKITMILQGNPTGVKRFLYKKDGKVTFAIGDMAASIDDIKEALDKKDEPFVKDLVKKLRGGSKTHAKQADDLEKALKEKDGHFMYKDGEKVLVKTKADHDKYAKMGYSMNEMKLSPPMIAKIKKTFEPLRGKKISPSAGDKLMKVMDKVDSDRQTLIDLMKADIPFVSQLAVTRLISKHNMKGAEINKLKEIFNIEEDYQLDEEPYVDTKKEYLVLIDKDNKIVAEFEGKDPLKDAKDSVRSAHLPPLRIPKNEVPKMRIVRMNKAGRDRKIGDKLGALTVGLKVKVGKMQLGEMAYKPGSFKDTRPQEKGAKAFDKLIQTGGLDKKDFQKAKQLYVQASDAGSREKLKKFIYNLDTEPTEAIMDLIGRNDPETFVKMYPKSKKGERLSTISFAHRNVKAEEVERENEMTEKLTDGNLSLKETVLKMWQEAKSPEQQAAIAISKKEKEKKEEPDEGNLFGKKLKDARDKGEKTFTVAGKTYDVEKEEKKLDKVNPVAVKKKFKDRKDKDLDNDGDVDDTDKFLHKRRKAISKAIASEDASSEYQRYLQTKKGSLRDSILKVWGEDAHGMDKKDLTKDKKDGKKKMTDTGKEITPVEMSPKMPKTKNERNKV